MQLLVSWLYASPSWMQLSQPGWKGLKLGFHRSQLGGGNHQGKAGQQFKVWELIGAQKKACCRVLVPYVSAPIRRGGTARGVFTRRKGQVRCSKRAHPASWRDEPHQEPSCSQPDPGLLPIELWERCAYIWSLWHSWWQLSRLSRGSGESQR